MKLSRAAAALLGLLGLGCATLLAPDPLGALHPFVWPAAGRVELFTCRWRRAAPLRVSLEGARGAQDRRAVAAALAAWEEAGIGVRFRSVTPPQAQIRIHLLDRPLQRAGGREAAGRTQADCLVPAGRVARAHLVAADVEVSTVVGPDWRDHVRPASPAELAGTVLHELGHALGFAGHPASGDPMVLESEADRRFGRRILAGRPVHSAALSALYALPSGTVLVRSPVDAWRTEVVDRLRAIASREGAQGPFARAGDTAAAVFWREPDGALLEVLVPELASLRRDPRQVLPVPGPRARALLAAARPAPTGRASAPAPRAAPPAPPRPSP